MKNEERENLAPRDDRPSYLNLQQNVFRHRRLRPFNPDMSHESIRLTYRSLFSIARSRPGYPRAKSPPSNAYIYTPLQIDCDLVSP